MRRWLTAVFLSIAAFAQSARLPVKRVVLYKNGMGYFEHSGRVTGGEDVGIDFTTAQLNDVLKSLTALDLGKGRITGISYNSIDPINKRLGALRLPLGESTTTAQFLDAMRGARIEVRSGTQTSTGRMLSVEQRELAAKDNQKITITQISLVSDSGEVRQFDLTPATSVRIIEKDLTEEVGRYMHLVASTRDQDVRRLTISTAGSGEREMLVSYISEVPIWKCTYRIVVPKDGKPLLQGWAIVDNTVGEDWNNVELSLVAGAPQSFIQDLSQPYYARRPVVPMPENAMTTPQTHEAALEEKEDAAAPEASVQNGFPKPPPPPPSNATASGEVGGGMLSDDLKTARWQISSKDSMLWHNKTGTSPPPAISATCSNINSKTASPSTKINQHSSPSFRPASTPTKSQYGIPMKAALSARYG